MPEVCKIMSAHKLPKFVKTLQIASKTQSEKLQRREKNLSSVAYYLLETLFFILAKRFQAARW